MQNKRRFKQKSASRTRARRRADLLESQEIDIPTETVEPQIKTLPGQRKVWWGIIGFGIILALIIGIAVGLTWYFSKFETAAGVPAIEVLRSVRDGMNYDPFSATGNVTLLVLGTDELAQRNGALPLTDTIMLITFQKNGHVHIISIPRDLWMEAYKTKVNGLYTFAEQNEPGSGPDIIKTTLGEITGLPIDYFLILKMGTLKEIIDTLGGIDIQVEHGFTDSKFPRANVDISTQDPEQLYETVTFNQGRQHFDGETALKYIRSRQSTDPQEGNDLARNRRQQKVVAAIVSQLSPKILLTNVTLLGQLYHLYHENIQTDLPDPVLIGLVKALIGKVVNVRPIPIPVETDDQEGLLRENPKNYQGLWVLEPIDPSWSDLQTFLHKQINTP